MGLSNLIILFFALQSFLLAAFFLIKKPRVKTANVFLAIFLVSSSWALVSSVLYWTKLLYTINFVHFDRTYHIPVAVFAPSFYLYLRGTCSHKVFMLKKDFFHFIPLGYVLFCFTPYYLLSKEIKLGLIETGDAKAYFPYFHKDFDLLAVGFMLVYSIILVKKYWKWYQGNFDMTVWLRAIILAFIGSVLSFFTYYALYYLGLLGVGEDYFIILILAIFILIISYFAYNHSNVFMGIEIKKYVPFIKYRKTGLTNQYSQELKRQLESLMEKDKPYLNPELRLDELSDLIGISRHHMSQVINEHFHQNFFDFVNTYRVEESKKLIADKGKKINLSEVGFDAGFNNTVSFNLSFKKNTGITPSQYRRSCQN